MTTLNVLAVIGGRGVVLGFLLPMAIVALVAYGVFELIRSRDASPAAAAGSPNGVPATTVSTSALTILDERFARGELDAEEYVQRRSLLVPPAAPVWSPEPAVAAPAGSPGVDADAVASVDPAATSEQPAATPGTSTEPDAG